MSSLFTSIEKREWAFIFSSLKKSCFKQLKFSYLQLLIVFQLQNISFKILGAINLPQDQPRWLKGRALASESIGLGKSVPLPCCNASHAAQLAVTLVLNLTLPDPPQWREAILLLNLSTLCILQTISIDNIIGNLINKLLDVKMLISLLIKVAWHACHALVLSCCANEHFTLHS